MTASVHDRHPLILHLGPVLKHLSDRELFEFCQLNRDLSLELTSDGDLIVMPPTGGETGRQNFNLAGQFYAWVRRDGSGIGFDSSTLFALPNGAKRSPDVAWVQRSRWEKLSEEERRQLLPLCPDFVAELRSASDSLASLEAKMREYIDNGARLGWLIDPIECAVSIYRPGEGETRLDSPATVSGDPVLRGFVLDLGEVWEADERSRRE